MQRQQVILVLVGSAAVALAASVHARASASQHVSALEWAQARSPRQSSSPPAARNQAAIDLAPHQAVLTRYCISCHNDRAKTGGLSLESVNLASAGDNPEVWEKVVQKLHGNLMPPGGRPRPDEATSQNLISYLEASLDRAAEARSNPGRTEALHRLNRAEYRNAVRDLLALDIDVSTMLPADDVSYGFDNIAGVQRMSPTLMERYIAAAQKIIRSRSEPLRNRQQRTRSSFRQNCARTTVSKAFRSARAAARHSITCFRVTASTTCAFS